MARSPYRISRHGFARESDSSKFHHAMELYRQPIRPFEESMAAEPGRVLETWSGTMGER